MDNNSEHDRKLRDLLKDYPMPEATAAYYDDALAAAAKSGARRQRRRWIMTGFGSAIAAGLAIWLMSSLLLDAPAPADVAIPEVSIALDEPKTINLVFASATALDAALLTVTLPDGIELAGFPGQKTITWKTSLAEGRNRLPLKLIALTPRGGELKARLEHNDRDREFRLRVDVS